MVTESIAQNGYNLDASILYSPPGSAGGLMYIEQLAAKQDCLTPKKPWMVAKNAETKTAIFFQPTCKLWSCPSCGRSNARRWVATGINGTETLLADGVELDFVTLTPHEKLSIAQSFFVYPLAWPKLYRRYKRAVSPLDPKAYIAVPERQPRSGKHHCHLIISGGLSQKWWKDNARQCGLGYQCKVKKVTTAAVGSYIAKYLGKTLTEGWPKHKRRINASRQWPIAFMPDKIGWEFATYPTDDKLTPILGELSANGYTTIGSTTASAWTLLDDLSPVNEFTTG